MDMPQTRGQLQEWLDGWSVVEIEALSPRQLRAYKRLEAAARGQEKRMQPYLFVIVKNPTVNEAEDGISPVAIYPPMQGGTGTAAFVMASSEKDALTQAGAFVPEAMRGNPLVEIHVTSFR